jgi:transcriptional pleiotropic regulator of transition state genes
MELGGGKLKDTGMVRRLDDLGRIVIPKEVRRTLGMADGDAIEIYVDGEGVVLRKQESRICPHCKKKLEGEGL